MPTSDLMTTAQAAAMLERDTATVNRWAKEGRLRVAMKGPGLRGPRWFRRRDIERLAAQLREEEPAATA